MQKSLSIMMCLMLTGSVMMLDVTLLQAQNSVLDLGIDNEKKADQYFRYGSFRAALDLYQHVYKKEQSKGLQLKIARGFYYLHEYGDCVLWYQKYAQKNSLPDRDLFNYAEALAAGGQYDASLEYYRQYAGRYPDDELIKNKIWRLSNLEYLFEDSLQYSVRYLPINSPDQDFAAVPYGKGLVFLSNRSSQDGIDRIDASTKRSFFSVFHSPAVPNDSDVGSNPKRFSKALGSKFHNGPISFYDEEQKVVYTATSSRPGKHGGYVLQLFFAEKKKNGWVQTGTFPFNSMEYSMTDPFINNEGTILYFASDLKGGFGGKDLYRAVKENGKWTSPVNLGEKINTRGNECFPFIQNHVLYFSSDGQPGMGGLDIFKTTMVAGDFGEVENLGYPLNSSADDFAFTLISEGYKGYFTSNRSLNKTEDDIYEVEIDQQTYPLVIQGILKLKEFSWMESDELKILPEASLFLIDHTRNITVMEATSDERGKFSLNIPYFSLYKIKVIQPGGAEALVSLEIPRQRKEDYHHEIVIVRDAFKSQ